MLKGEDEKKNIYITIFLKKQETWQSCSTTINQYTGGNQVLNKQYQSVFTNENNLSIPPVNNQNLNMPDINFTTNPISKLLSKLNRRANAPDKIPIRFLKDYAYDISKSLKNIFPNSYITGDLPRDWLTADVIPFFKKKKGKQKT